MSERNTPWMMTTIGEVIEAMRLLIANEGCELETPIVRYQLHDDCLTSVAHECCHVFHDDDESWVELTLHDPHDGEEQ